MTAGLAWREQIQKLVKGDPLVARWSGDGGTLNSDRGIVSLTAEEMASVNLAGCGKRQGLRP